MGHANPDSGPAAADPDLEELLRRIAEFSEEKELPDEILARMLLHAALHITTVGYVLSEEKPTARGLRRQFDRFYDTCGDFVNGFKQIAAETLAEMLARKGEDDSAAVN